MATNNDKQRTATPEVRPARGGFTLEELAALYAARFERSLFREPGDIQLDDDTGWIANYDPEAATFIRDFFVSIDWVARHGEQVGLYRDVYLSAFKAGLNQGWLEFMVEEAERAGSTQIEEWALDYGINLPKDGPIPKDLQRAVRDARRAEIEAENRRNRQNFDVVRAVLGLGGFLDSPRRAEFDFGINAQEQESGAAK